MKENKKLKYKINKGFITQKVGNSLTIFDPEKSVLFTLNETGAFIFSCLKKGLSRDEIINLVIKKYNIETSQAEQDYQEFTARILKNGILDKIIT